MSRTLRWIGVFVFCTAALAAPVQWTLSGVRFADGGTAGGSFVYDASTNTFSSINVATTSTGTFTGQHYVAAVTSVSGALFLVTVTSSSFTTGTPYLFLFPVSSMTNAGGTISLTVGTSPNLDSSEGQCGNTVCSSPATSPVRQVTAGAIVGTPLTTAIPAVRGPGLAALALLLAAVASLMARRQEFQT